MSNGDDVLDNWEEIDEAGLDSKVDKIKEELRTQLQKKQQLEQGLGRTQQEQQREKLLLSEGVEDGSFLQRQHQQQQLPFIKSPLDDMSSFQSNVPVMMVLHKSEDEYQSANYMQPTKSQTVKILRRPTQATEDRGNGMRPKQPIKTLKQREQEYAEARLRILGAAKNPEDDVETSSNSPSSAASKVHLKAPADNPNNSYYNTSNSPAAQPAASSMGGVSYNRTAASQVIVSGVGGAGGASQMWSSPLANEAPGVVGLFSPASLRQQQECVLRMPRGPDGSMGFNIRR